MKTLFALLITTASFASFGQKIENKVVDVTGTTWFKDMEGVDDLVDQNITFLWDGKILEELDETSPEMDHHWEQNGNKLTFSYNGEYAVYKGKIKGDTVKGKAKNIAGKKWTFTLTRVYPTSEPK